MVVNAAGLIQNIDPSAGADNNTAYFQVQDNIARSTIILKVLNNAPHGLDGYNVGIGVCVPNPVFKAALRAKIKNLRNKIKRANRKHQSRKVRNLRRKLNKLSKQLRALS